MRELQALAHRHPYVIPQIPRKAPSAPIVPGATGTSAAAALHDGLFLCGVARDLCSCATLSNADNIKVVDCHRQCFHDA